MILQLCDQSNRQKLFSRLDEMFIMGDHGNIIEQYFDDVLKTLFDILKDSDS
jgi:hypothetical protein